MLKKKKKEKRNASIVDEAARLKVEPKNNTKSVTQCFALLALNRNLNFSKLFCFIHVL